MKARFTVTPIFEFQGSTESKVVEDALAEWVEEGAEIVELSRDESWAAVKDSRDVAIAYPEACQR